MSFDYYKTYYYFLQQFNYPSLLLAKSTHFPKGITTIKSTFSVVVDRITVSIYNHSSIIRITMDIVYSNSFKITSPSGSSSDERMGTYTSPSLFRRSLR
mmetsp:Transcript_2452/g.2963  ORF Transcript_2452/g.2963 Transcript_2452/m.2963 type:complete len:99 (+) Transcript_2452:124-420(+)